MLVFARSPHAHHLSCFFPRLRSSAPPSESQLHALESAAREENTTHVRQAVSALAEQHQYNPNNEISGEEKFKQAVAMQEEAEDSGKANRLTKGVDTYLATTSAAENRNEKLAKSGELALLETGDLPVLYGGSQGAIHSLGHAEGSLQTTPPALMPSAASSPVSFNDPATDGRGSMREQTMSIFAHKHGTALASPTPGYTMTVKDANREGLGTIHGVNANSGNYYRVPPQMSSKFEGYRAKAAEARPADSLPGGSPLKADPSPALAVAPPSAAPQV